MNNAVLQDEQDIQSYRALLYKQVREAEVIYEWKCTLVDKGKIGNTLFSLVSMTMFCGLLYYLSPGIEVFYFWLVINALFLPVSYFLFDADNNYHAKITTQGVIISETEQVPEIFYKATRGVAYFGILVCVLAVSIMGPLALVGAGAMALMSVKMTGFAKEPREFVMPFTDQFPYIYTEDKKPIYKHSVIDLFYSNPEERLNDEYSLVLRCYRVQFPEIDRVLRKYINVVN